MNYGDINVEQGKVDSGFECLALMSALHGIAFDRTSIAHEFGPAKFNNEAILLAAKSLGIVAKAVKQSKARLPMAPLPALARTTEGEYLVVAKFDPTGDGRLLIQKHGSGPQFVGVDLIEQVVNSELIFFTSKSNFAADAQRFDFTWFVPSIVKYRHLLLEVLLISFFIQIIGLVTPMFFQVVMDKVLVNHAMKTLNVIAIGLICATLFEALLGIIRTQLFSRTSSKIDVELGSGLFRHLLGLPLNYFHSRRVGDSVARIKEIENIRSFLTGNAMTLVMDLMFSFVFFAAMFYYSIQLALIVVASIPIYFAVSLVFTPVLRRKLNEKFNRSAENQSFLVETLSGIDTVKAMAVEPQWQKKWDKQLAAYVSGSLSATNVASIAGSSVNTISKIVTAAIMWFGASQVIDGNLTVGELVAFNMLANQVSSPILRLAQLWNDFQQIGISMKRLGDVLNAQPEISGQKTPITRLYGVIEFDSVTFRYLPDGNDVLKGVRLKICAGEVIGIVGRSGSGKSTLTKLVQRLYSPSAGRVLIDQHDISIVNTASLRSQIGVVLQENTLFNRSIRENIALANPSLPMEVVIKAAKLAGAHDFICELRDAYDTVVGEGGAGLSGGQRQRIAIARALITNPRILIFDEATSALDYESEKVIQDNMRDICKGRTVIIIAHRLSAVRDASRIVVMERGGIAEVGSHQQLIGIEGGIYRHLYEIQNGRLQKVAA